MTSDPLRQTQILVSNGHNFILESPTSLHVCIYFMVTKAVTTQSSIHMVVGMQHYHTYLVKNLLFPFQVVVTPGGKIRALHLVVTPGG